MLSINADTTGSYNEVNIIDEMTFRGYAIRSYETLTTSLTIREVTTESPVYNIYSKLAKRNLHKIKVLFSGSIIFLQITKSHISTDKEIKFRKQATGIVNPTIPTCI